MTLTDTRCDFDLSSFLRISAGQATALEYTRGEVIFSQGDAADAAYYVVSGTVKFSVVSRAGKDAIVALYRAQEFFGESVLIKNPTRRGTATAMNDCRIVVIQRNYLLRALTEQPAFSAVFLEQMVARTTHLESDLVERHFNTSEQRLARLLIDLSSQGTSGESRRTLPKLSQTDLAEMVGTTRSRINVFMNKFRDLGFIDYDGTITVHDTLLRVA